MANSKHVVYKSDGPHMEGAVRASAGQEPGGSYAGHAPSPVGNGTSPSGRIGNAVVGSMPVVNQIMVKSITLERMVHVSEQVKV